MIHHSPYLKDRAVTLINLLTYTVCPPPPPKKALTRLDFIKVAALFQFQ